MAWSEVDPESRGGGKEDAISLLTLYTDSFFWVMTNELSTHVWNNLSHETVPTVYLLFHYTYSYNLQDDMATV